MFTQIDLFEPLRCLGNMAYHNQPNSNVGVALSVSWHFPSDYKQWVTFKSCMFSCNKKDDEI